MKPIIRITLILVFALTLVWPSSAVRAQAPVPACPKGGCPNTPAAPSGFDVTAQQTAVLNPYIKVTQRGYYAASGVGLRNLGQGTLSAPVLPANSTITKAYLFWTVIGPPSTTYAKGTFAAHAITGTLVGSAVDPFFRTQKIYAYRADVKAYLLKSGGGTYFLSGFASGNTHGDDPSIPANDVLPLLDGASLVVVFSNASYPITTVQIFNGATTLRGGTYLHLDIPGVNTVAPTGLADTTFIGADGWSGIDGATHFFETPLPTVTWNGSDPNGNGTSYLHGNLWDTTTVDLHAMLTPPENDFWFSTSKVWDITWVAQVVGYSNGDQDSDGDGLKDNWELNGYNGVNLPTLGASMFHKDLFIEADYMVNSGNYLPPKAQLDDIVAVFNNAPVNNPDGSTGIHIHIDTGGADATNGPGTYPAYDLGGGNAVTFAANLGSDTVGCTSYDWTAFQSYKNVYFGSYRSPIFHYMIFANELSTCLGTTSGISRNATADAAFVKGATDFIVSLGGWGSHGTASEREGTFIHELGHNLGLRHGGNDHVNYKPNYLSVMNYLYQTIGVYYDGGPHFDYSRLLLPNVSEASLKESKGLGSQLNQDGYFALWFCPNGAQNISYNPGYSVDWNCDGVIQTSSVKVDTNRDGKLSSLGSQNNWASITFKGGGVIGTGLTAGQLQAQAQVLSITPWVNELKEDQVPPAW